MCFRPATTSGPTENFCPECGKPIIAMPGVSLTSCMACGCDLSSYMNEEKAAQAPVKAPTVPRPTTPPPGAPKTMRA